VKLFLNNSNLCNHDTSTSRTDGQTTCGSNTALYVASRCKNCMLVYIHIYRVVNTPDFSS